MKKLIFLVVAAIAIMTTSCMKKDSDIPNEGLPQDPGGIPGAQFQYQANGLTYSGYLLQALQIEDGTGYYRITAQVGFNQFTVWMHVLPANVSFQPVNNTANAPAVFLEYNNGVFDGNYVIQIPPGYTIGAYHD